VRQNAVESLGRSSGADAEKALRRLMDALQAGKLPPESVARVIVEAIESDNPRTRYRITRLARVLILLRRLMPDRFFDRRMNKALKLPDRI
jgi:hypothetical protein